MVKFKLLAQFPVDHLTHPVVSSRVLLLCQFSAFAYYAIDGFISGPLEKGPRVSNEWYSPSIYSFDKVSARKLFLSICRSRFLRAF